MHLAMFLTAVTDFMPHGTELLLQITIYWYDNVACLYTVTVNDCLLISRQTAFKFPS